MSTTKKKVAAPPVAVAEPKVAQEHAERIDVDRPDLYPAAMIERHRERYLWAMASLTHRFGRAAKVLDAACGTGYGSKMLLGAAAKVVGMDVADAALAHAAARFGGGLLKFRRADFRQAMPASTGEFDAAVTIETIEHVDERAADFFLEELFRVVATNGLLLLSTPIANAEKGMTSEYHLKEYSQAEMTAKVIAAGFVDVTSEDVVPGFMFLTARRPA